MEEANLYDKILKENIEQLLDALLFRLIGINSGEYTRITEKLQTTVEREADLLLKISPAGDMPYVLHLEWQTQIPRNMLYRMAEYHGMIQRKYELPIRHFVVYLGSKKINPLTNLPTEQIFTGYQLIKLNEWDAQQLLAASNPSEIILAILGNYPMETTERIISATLDRLVEVCNNPQELKTYTQQLLVLARLRNLTPQVIKNVETMPVTFDIEKDYLFTKGIEQGIEQGVLQEKLDAVKRLYQLGLDVSTIAAYTALPIQQIEQFIKSLNK